MPRLTEAIGKPEICYFLQSKASTKLPVMSKADIQWKQRFQNCNRALAGLKDAVNLASQRKLSELEELGLIKAFEFTHELAWNVLKDFFENQGETGILGSRDAVRLALDVV